MRIQNAARNSFFSLLTQVFLIVFAFLSNRAVNLYIGEAMVGINGTVTNVLGILSVTELGLGAALIYHLYGAVARKEEKKVAELVNLYRFAYNILALVILVLGLILLPFIPGLMKDNPFSTQVTLVIYCLWLLRSILSYLQAWPRSVLIADQKEYLISLTQLFIQVGNNLLIILIVRLTGSFIPALALNVAVEALLYFVLNRYILRKYSYLTVYRKLRPERKTIRDVFYDIKDIFISRIASKILVSTDNLIISGLISVVVSGLYNNYLLVTSALNGIVNAVINSVQPSMGNLFLEKDHEKEYGVLRQFVFLSFLIASFFASGLLALLSPFVSFWLGDHYLLPFDVVCLLVGSVFFAILSLPLSVMMTAAGEFGRERNLSIVSAAANLILSLLLVKPLGISGVLLGTIAAYFILIWGRLFLFCRNYLKKPVLLPAMEMLLYFALGTAETVLTLFVTNRIGPSDNLPKFLLCFLLCVLIPNGCNLLLFFRTWKFKSLKWMVHVVLKRKQA